MKYTAFKLSSLCFQDLLIELLFSWLQALRRLRFCTSMAAKCLPGALWRDLQWWPWTTATERTPCAGLSHEMSPVSSSAPRSPKLGPYQRNGQSTSPSTCTVSTGSVLTPVLANRSLHKVLLACRWKQSWGIQYCSSHWRDFRGFHSYIQPEVQCLYLYNGF